MLEFLSKISVYYFHRITFSKLLENRRSYPHARVEEWIMDFLHASQDETYSTVPLRQPFRRVDASLSTDLVGLRQPKYTCG